VTYWDGVEHVFIPRWLSEGANNSFLKKHNRVEFFDTVLEFCLKKRPERVCLYRTYALGDILMLLPLARRLYHAAGLRQPIEIVVEDRFIESLAMGLDDWREIHFLRMRADANKADYGCDVHVDLNHVLEPDHWGGEESNYHRVELYARVLGFEIIT
jgi:hypothetical protein